MNSERREYQQLDSIYSRMQLISLVILRVFIGWHFLYEGYVKLINPYWSSAEYLQQSQWILSKLFHWIAETPPVLQFVDWLNIWGLILIGIGLIAGCFTRLSCVGGMVLLSLYYFSNPPFIGSTFLAQSEGSYLFINKNLIEIAALVVLLVFPTGHLIGIDRIMTFFKRKESK